MYCTVLAVHVHSLRILNDLGPSTYRLPPSSFQVLDALQKSTVPDIDVHLVLFSFRNKLYSSSAHITADLPL